MATTYYKLLSQDQAELGNSNHIGLSLTATSDATTSSSSDDDSLDLALLKIGNKRPKRIVRRKPRRRGRAMGNLSNFEGGESYEELIGSAKRRRQLLKLTGLFVVAVLVIGAIVLAVYLVTGDDNFEEDTRERIELGDILNGTFSVKRFNGTWIDDNSYQFWDMSGNLRVNNVKLKTSEVIVWQNQTDVTQASSHEFSFDKSFILISSQILKLFRHSSLAYWDIYDVKTKRLLPITLNGSRQPLQFAKFSPADNSLIFVQDNNIYYKKLPTDAGEIQLTKDGSLSSGIFNGVPDWVYEEEIFSSNSALWFSPDGKKLAFMRFDDTQVRPMHLPIYGGPGDPTFQYPQTLQVHYPKAASKNPEVKLFTVDLSAVTDSASAAAATKEIATPARFVNTHVDHIISSVSWATNADLIAVFMNRVQNQADITKCTVGSDIQCTNILQLDVKDGWVEFYTAPFYIGTDMIFINSESGFHHVVAVNINSGVRVARSSGNFTVDQILGVSKANNLIYFTANTEDDVKDRHVYVIKNENGAKKMCLTCQKEGHFDRHSYFDAEISTDGSHIAVSAEGPEIPMHALASIDLEKLDLTDIQMLERNHQLSSIVHGKKFPKVMFDKIQLDNENKSTAYVKMVVPSDYDPLIKYPMIVDVYGGPNSVSVTNRWSVDWGTYLVSGKDYIYVRIDGRGSGNKGDENLFTMYRKLGTVEVEDQIETAKKLQHKYKFIDEHNSAIWGWSYGGYVSGMSLAKDTENVFKCGVSVAPVTDWTLYDSIYTERYMGLPIIEDNQKNYASAQLMQYVENFRTNNKTYMLVHGTLDDNVHFQQGMMLARALELKDIMFREVTYPDEDHSLARVRPHLYHTLEHFFSECFLS